MQLLGLHHVTAVTGRAPDNLRFYTAALGMRLVKKTVNQDDVSAYHLYYGDELGSPGTLLTFFDWPHAGPTRHGVGTVSEIRLRVAGGRGALAGWALRLSAHGGHPGEVEGGEGTRATLAFTDSEGQRLRLCAEGGREAGGLVPAVRGLESVVLSLRRLEGVGRVLVDTLGFRHAGEDGREHVFETGLGGPGTRVRVSVEPPHGHGGRAGIGGVHHVAFRVPNATEQGAWRERLLGAGLPVSEIIDRFYFQSVYFREPASGVLFEIATDGPGFATDEDPAHLGEHLALPPFLEGMRARITVGLRPLA